MWNFPNIEFNIGILAKDLVDFLDRVLDGFFNFIFLVASNIIKGIEGFLTWMPWFVFVIIIFLLCWFFSSFFSGILFSIFLFLIDTFGLWDDMMLVIAFITSAVFSSLLVGIRLRLYIYFSK